MDTEVVIRAIGTSAPRIPLVCYDCMAQLNPKHGNPLPLKSESDDAKLHHLRDLQHGDLRQSHPCTYVLDPGTAHDPIL